VGAVIPFANPVDVSGARDVPDVRLEEILTATITGSAHAVPSTYPNSPSWQRYFRDRFGGDTGLGFVAEEVWKNTGISARHSVVDPRVEDIDTWTTAQRMERFMIEAMPLGKEAIAGALEDADLDAADIGLFGVVCCTGYGTPGLDLRLANAMAMSDEVQRVHIGHMGCYAAIPGLRTVSDFVLAHDRPALLLCLELTSLHAQPASQDLEQIVAHAIFADAAAAVVVQPGTHNGWEVLDTLAVTDHATARLMTWDITDHGFRMGLSAMVPKVLGKHVLPATAKLLARHGLHTADVEGWAIHPGGRRIVEVVGARLGLDDAAVAPSLGVLNDFGNCSSPTVLLVLERLDVQSGGYAVAMAFGPGLTLYLTLLRRV
jgi:predicted naringenin-chalcone synthase